MPPQRKQCTPDGAPPAGGPECEVAKALVRARLDAGLTQKDVAGRMGVMQSNIARLESGANVSVRSIARYARAVGRPILLEFSPE